MAINAGVDTLCDTAPLEEVRRPCAIDPWHSALPCTVSSGPFRAVREWSHFCFEKRCFFFGSDQPKTAHSRYEIGPQPPEGGSPHVDPHSVLSPRVSSA
jgi:hypothetical protein